MSCRCTGGGVYRAARVLTGMTQEQAARTMGVGVNSVQRWEQGKNEPLAPNVALMARAYHVSADALLGLKPLELEGEAGCASL